VNVLSRESKLASTISWNIKDGVLNISARDLNALERSNGTVDVIVSAPRDVNYQIGYNMEEVSSSQRSIRPFRRHRR
jgi:hypothetical protein